MANTILEPTLTFIDSSNGDKAFFVNGECIVSAWAQANDDPLIVEETAASISKALAVDILNVKYTPLSDDEDWADMYDNVQDGKGI